MAAELGALFAWYYANSRHSLTLLFTVHRDTLTAAAKLKLTQKKIYKKKRYNFRSKLLKNHLINHGWQGNKGKQNFFFGILHENRWNFRSIVMRTVLDEKKATNNVVYAVYTAYDKSHYYECSSP